MTFCFLRLPLSLSIILFTLLPGLHRSAQADEGMWLYNQPPIARVQEKYGFVLTPSWLEHLQKASVRFGVGGSAEFVSTDGLVLSNHHIGAGALQRLSTPEHNYMRDGFYARTLADEKPCPGTELYVLMNMQDVTERVNSAVTPGMSDEAAFKARRAVMAGIEKESVDKTGLHGEVVTLYQGAKYHLYQYKKYTDVRLVFAPEDQIAFYGGDPDNFEYPRFDLDICVFRAYENGLPARVAHHLSWSKSGPANNELVFVSGHPGRTDRLRTMAELEYLRDLEYPRTLQRLKRVEVLLSSWSARGAENARRARTELFSVKNARKVRDGALAGLLTPGLLAQKAAAEARLRAAAATNSALGYVSGAIDRIAEAYKASVPKSLEYDFLERGYGFNSALFDYARALWRVSEERSKPESERLEEYRESDRASFEHRLFAETPLYPDLQSLKLSDSLTSMAGALGYEHPLVRQILGDKSPGERAAELVRGTRLASASFRRELYALPPESLRTNADPMLQLARAVDPAARELRGFMEVQQEAIRQSHARLGQARYALAGEADYPDATGTLRLAFGTAEGYEEAGGHVPFETTFGGLFERAAAHEYRPPFDLPARWRGKRSKLNLATPLNFVCTDDIIGGNSGSPVVNRNGELVGVIFDGNIHSLVAAFLYTDEQCRALAVHSSAIIEALRKVYDAGPLADELLGRRRPRS